MNIGDIVRTKVSDTEYKFYLYLGKAYSTDTKRTEERFLRLSNAILINSRDSITPSSVSRAIADVLEYEIERFTFSMPKGNTIVGIAFASTPYLRDKVLDIQYVAAKDLYWE